MAATKRNKFWHVSFMFVLNEAVGLKFTIEIYATLPDSSETLLYRADINAFSPAAARKEAGRLLARRERANFTHVLNAQGEIIYKIDRSRP